jgi:hypothetical protein
MTRSEAGECHATIDNRHRWIETTTKDNPGREWVCGACKTTARESLRTDGR